MTFTRYFCRGVNPADLEHTAQYSLSPHYLELAKAGGPKAHLAELENARLVVAAPSVILESHNGHGYYLVGRPERRWVSETRHIPANLREIFIVEVDRGLVITDHDWHTPHVRFPGWTDPEALVLYLGALGRSLLRTH